ncbi:hypothetical protein CANCADRAFT_19189, partial [Tortispora caseinolytica NRRL Y-17796]
PPKFLLTPDWNKKIVPNISLQQPVIVPSSFYLSASLSRLLSQIVKSFVASWHSTFASTDLFPRSVESLLHLILRDVSAKLIGIDWPSTIVCQFLPLVSTHIHEYAYAESLVFGDSDSLTESLELDQAICNHYNNGKLHPALQKRSVSLQKEWLSTKLLPYTRAILPQQYSSDFSLFLANEILACGVVFPTLNALADPNVWNNLILNLAGKTLDEQRTVKKLRSALELHTQDVKLYKLARIYPKMENKSFERVTRNLTEITSIAQLRKLKHFYGVALSEERRRQSTTEDAAYISRLIYARRIIDQRLKKLSGNMSISQSKSIDMSHDSNHVALKDILQDSSGLLAFTEFMDRRKRSVLVQFWLVVEGFRSPLDEDFLEQSSIQPVDMSGASDIEAIYATYFRSPMIHPPLTLKNQVEQFMISKSPEDYLAARRAIITLQSLVYEHMNDKDFPEFKETDLFSQVLMTSKVTPTIHQSNSFASLKSDPLLSPTVIESNLSAPATPLSLTSIINEDIQISKNGTSSPTPGSRSSTPGQKRYSHKRVVSEAPDLFGNEATSMFNEVGLFDDNLVSSDVENDDGDADGEYSDIAKVAQPIVPSHLHDPLPGDLRLKELIEDLEESLASLYGQKKVLDSLIKKAEITDSKSELKYLRKSFASISREIQFKEMQKGLYESKAQSIELNASTSVKIAAVNVIDNGMSEYAIYDIHIAHKLADDSVVRWTVKRRYRQFYILNSALKEMFPEVSRLEFPKKSVLKFQRPFLDNRRAALEKYLQGLLCIRGVCASKPFRFFMSTDEKERVDEGEANGEANNGVEPYKDADRPPIQILKSLLGPEDTDPEDLAHASGLLGATDSAAIDDNYLFLKSVTDLLYSIFDASWLKGRTNTLLIQQIFGSTVEKRVRGAIEQALAGDRLTDYVENIHRALFPDPDQLERLPANKRDTLEALSKSIEGNLGYIMGQQAGERAAHRVFAPLQNRQLNLHVLYSLFEVLLKVVF